MSFWSNDTTVKVRKRNRKIRRRKSRRKVLALGNSRSARRRRERTSRLTAALVFVLLVALSICILTLGILALGRSMFARNARFTIHRLELRSDGILHPVNIREYAQVAPGMNLFALDLRKIRRRLNSVSVVKNVEVQRILPDTLKINIVERIPLARLGANDRRNLYALDREGRVLGPRSRLRQLPAIAGYHAADLRPGDFITDPVIRDALQVLDICDTTYLGRYIKIRSIAVNRSEFLDIRLAAGTRVMFKRSRIVWRLRKLARILVEARDRGLRPHFVDMTVDRNFAVR